MRIDDAQHYRALLFEKANEIMAIRGREYSVTDDTFANLKACEAFGIMKAELGVWVRLSDKVARLGSLLKDRYNPEAVLDTVIDLINYASYIYLLMMEKDPAYAHLLEGKKDAKQNP